MADQLDFDGFDLRAHRRYVEAGGCPFTEGKTWCNGRNDDLHQYHWAPYLEPNGNVRHVTFRHPERRDTRRVTDPSDRESSSTE